jgi:hypothetical protein
MQEGQLGSQAGGQLLGTGQDGFGQFGTIQGNEYLLVHGIYLLLGPGSTPINPVKGFLRKRSRQDSSLSII